jgi:hypothetical protein
MKVSTLCLLLLALGGCCVFGGCRAWRPKPDPNGATRQEWKDTLKALKGTEPLTGVSKESREIEKSLSGF